MTTERQWNIGFEIELILDSLGEKRFLKDAPMDEATPAYCRKVAKILASGTGRPWRLPASKAERDVTGYYVVPEYDLDPIGFDGDQVGGVELITPPLPIDAAADLRSGINALIAGHAEDMMFDDIANDTSGWHINVDIDGRMPDPVTYLLCVDEYEMLCGTGREGRWGCAPLVRPVFLRALEAGMRGETPEITWDVLTDVVREADDKAKLFAANFSRGGYVELRHRGAIDFLDGNPLISLLHPLIDGWPDDDDEKDEALLRLRTRAEVLAGIAADYQDRIEVLETCTNEIFGDDGQDILLDGEVVGVLERASGFMEEGDQPVLHIVGQKTSFSGTVNRWEIGDPIAKVLLLAYEHAAYSNVYLSRPPTPSSEVFRDLADEITRRMHDRGVSLSPGYTLMGDDEPDVDPCGS